MKRRDGEISLIPRGIGGAPLETLSVLKPAVYPLLVSPRLNSGDGKPTMLLDCSACKTPQMMEATVVPRFAQFIRFLGYLIVAPSVLGVAAAGFLLIWEIVGVVRGHEPAFVMVMSIVIGVTSLVGGLVGWLLLSQRKVYKCDRCGFILDRA